MKILVAGATGVVGYPLVLHLLAKGHDVVALTRSSKKAQELAKQGVELAIADVFDQGAVKAAIAQAQPEIVIEQLTALPKTYPGQSMAAAATLNARLRLEGGQMCWSSAGGWRTPLFEAVDCVLGSSRHRISRRTNAFIFAGFARCFSRCSHRH